MAGCGPSAGWDGYEGHSHHGFRRGGWGGDRGGYFLRGFLSRLDATPTQEKEIRAALEELKNAAREARTDLEASRANLAHTIKGETFDEIAMGEANVSFDKSTAKAKESLEAALRRVHAVLDPKQREKLSSLVEDGTWRRWGGPYRSADL
jgi:Spy/CpxP family protein refolding chaperone